MVTEIMITGDGALGEKGDGVVTETGLVVVEVPWWPRRDKQWSQKGDKVVVGVNGLVAEGCSEEEKEAWGTQLVCDKKKKYLQEGAAYREGA